MIERVTVYVQTHGVRRTGAAAVRRARSATYRRERLYVLRKDLGTIVEARCRYDFRIEDLGVEHLAGLSKLNRSIGRPHIDRRFARNVADGYRGFVAFRGDQLIGYYWWTDGKTQKLHPDLAELGLGIEVGEGDVYGSDLFLLEDHRGGGTAGRFLFEVETALRDRGFRVLWGYVDRTNRPARWLYATRGYEPAWNIDRRTILSRRRTVLSPLDEESHGAEGASPPKP